MTREEIEEALNHIQAVTNLITTMGIRERATWNALSTARVELASHAQELGYRVSWSTAKSMWRVK